MIKKQLRELKEIVYMANMELYDRGLVIHTFGNVSGIDRDQGIIAIKPSGIDYSELSPENIVLVTLDGEIVESELNPSIDTPTHIELYRAFPEIGGVVHTHSRYATSWAQANKTVPCFGTTHADYFFGEIPCTRLLTEEEVRENYEANTGKLIAETFRENSIDYGKMRAVLVGGHGPFTWGKDPEEAVFLSSMLEEVSYTAYMSLLINPELQPIPRFLLEKHYLRKHGVHAYYGQRRKRRHKQNPN